MAKPIPLSGGKKMLPTREDLERQPLSFFAAGKKTGSPKYTISGVIQDDEGDPVPGVLVTLSGDADDTATTGVAGTFEFEDLSRGDYTVTPTKSQWVFTPASRSVTGLSEDTALAAFEGVGSIYSISGTISGDIATGVTVTLSGDASDSVVTGGDGTYVFEDLPDGDYTVTPTLAEYSFSPTSTNVTINNGNQSGKDFVSSVVEYAISGNVKDWEGANLSGVLITVTGDGSASDTTDASGNYSIDLPNGSYTFTPTKSGVEFTPASTAVTVAGSAQSGKDFAQATHTLSGTVSGDVASGVTITLTGDESDSTTTAGDGTYSFTLPNGSYTVTPTKTSYTFSPTSTAVTIASGDQTGKDFTATGDYITLPYTYNFSSRSEAVGTASSALPGMGRYVTGYSENMTLDTANLADSNSFTPTGVTKVLYKPGVDSTYGFGFTFPKSKKIDPSLTKIRFATLGYRASPGIDPWAWDFQVRNVTQDEMDVGGALTARAYGSVRPDYNPDRARIIAHYDSASNTDDTTIINMTPSANARCTRYFWIRYEMDFEADTIVISFVRCQDNSQSGSLTLNMNATGQALNHIPTGMKEFCVGTGASYNLIIAGFWIGEATDAWPTDTLAATTEDYVQYAVSGNVKDWEGANLSGVLVSVTGDMTASDTTDASGNYSVNLPNGSYTLTPTKSGVEFTPASIAVTVAGSAQSGKDFAQTTLLTLPINKQFSSDTTGVAPDHFTSWDIGAAFDNNIPIVAAGTCNNFSATKKLATQMDTTHTSSCNFDLGQGVVKFLPTTGLKVSVICWGNGNSNTLHLYLTKEPGEASYTDGSFNEGDLEFLWDYDSDRYRLQVRNGSGGWDAVMPNTSIGTNLNSGGDKQVGATATPGSGDGSVFFSCSNMYYTGAYDKSLSSLTWSYGSQLRYLRWYRPQLGYYGQEDPFMIWVGGASDSIPWRT